MRFIIDMHSGLADPSTEAGCKASDTSNLSGMPAEKLKLLRHWLQIELHDLRNADLLAPLVRHSVHVTVRRYQCLRKTRNTDLPAQWVQRLPCTMQLQQGTVMAAFVLSMRV